jgi:hypothetical protein
MGALFQSVGHNMAWFTVWNMDLASNIPSNSSDTSRKHVCIFFRPCPHFFLVWGILTHKPWRMQACATAGLGQDATPSQIRCKWFPWVASCIPDTQMYLEYCQKVETRFMEFWNDNTLCETCSQTLTFHKIPKQTLCGTCEGL